LYSLKEKNGGEAMGTDPKDPKKEAKTPKKKADYASIELKHYTDLLDMKDKVDKELKPLKQYLEKIGVLKKAEIKKKV